MNTAYVALGSNLENPVMQLRKALVALAQLPDSQLVVASRLFQNPPLGDSTQPDYVNAVAKLATSMGAHELLQTLLAIELQQGRMREHWESRTLDLDLLLFNQDIIQTQDLIVPHPGLTSRSFVIYPLLEIEPNLVLPNGISLQTLTAQVKNNLVVL